MVSRIGHHIVLTIMIFALSLFDAPVLADAKKSFQIEMIPLVAGAKPGRRKISSRMKISEEGLLTLKTGHDSFFLICHRSIAEIEDLVNDHVIMPMTQGQFDSLVCWAYRHGKRAFIRSRILKLINQANYTAAGLALLDGYDKNQRENEYRLFTNSQFSQF